MDKKNRVRTNREYRKIYDTGTSKANKLLVLFMKENGLGYNRVGYTVTKKVGKAVTRNRVRRLMKESYRKNTLNSEIGYDLIFLSRINCKEATYKEMESAVKHIIKISIKDKKNDHVASSR